jgi:cytochrome P450
MDGAAILGALISPEGRENPYPTYSAAHGAGPIADIGGGMFLVHSYEAVNKVLRSNAFVPFDERFERPFLSDWREHPSLTSLTRSVLDSNPPDHTRMREVMAHAFTARRVAALEPAITRLADGLLDELAEAGADGAPVDFMETFAFRLSVGVICELFAMPAADWPRFRKLGADWTEVFEVMPSPEGIAAADSAFLEFEAYFTDLVGQRRKEPGEDLVSAVIKAADEAAAPLSAEEIVCNLAVLLAAGYETATNLFGNGLGLLFQYPHITAGLRDGSIPVGGFVEEVLRFDSPVQIAGRVAAADTEVAGNPFPAGTWAIAVIGAANRDPARYEDPDVFDPLRPDIQPLSFGAGIHHCLGAPMARLEGAIAFTRLLERFSDLAPAGTPERRERLVLRGYQNLPVTVRAS